MGWQNMLPGPVTVGQDVPQIANMLANRDQQNRQNQLADIAFQRNESRYQQEQGDREQEQKLRSTLALARQGMDAPPEVQAQILARISQADPEFGQVFGRMPPDQAIKAAVAGISTKLGEPYQPAQQQTAQQYTLSPGAARYDSSGKLIAERGFAPPRQQSPSPPAGQPGGAPSKPLPIGALRLIDDAKQAIASTGESQALVDSAIATIQSGGVNLGAVDNLASRAKNFAGMSDPNSRAYADIRQTLEKLRNNYLLLAKGVQTEGDAQRAWNSEIGENVQNDNALALQQLKKAKGMIERAIAAQNSRIQSVQANYGAAPQNVAPSGPPSAPKPGQIVKGYRFKGGDPSNRGNWVKAQ